VETSSWQKSPLFPCSFFFQHGNRWLGVILVQVAWAASHTKRTYLSAQFPPFAGRRGRKRALLAVGHTLLTIIYHILTEGTSYREWGG
jgi:hypothetical protein